MIVQWHFNFHFKSPCFELVKRLLRSVVYHLLCFAFGFFLSRLFFAQRFSKKKLLLKDKCEILNGSRNQSKNENVFVSLNVHTGAFWQDKSLALQYKCINDFIFQTYFSLATNVCCPNVLLWFFIVHLFSFVYTTF